MARRRCNQPTENTVYFPAEVESRLRRSRRPISSLAISDHPLVVRRSSRSVPDGEVAGHEVQIAGHLCAEPKVMTCALDVAVPDLDAYFRITLHGTDVNEGLEAIRDTPHCPATDRDRGPRGSPPDRRGESGSRSSRSRPAHRDRHVCGFRWLRGQRPGRSPPPVAWSRPARRSQSKCRRLTRRPDLPAVLTARGTISAARDVRRRCAVVSEGGP